MELRAILPTATRAGAPGAMVVEIQQVVTNVYVSMRKRTLFLRQGVKESDPMAFFIAIREHFLFNFVLSSTGLVQNVFQRCPCLKCSIKIVQSGVCEVVYSLAYKM